MVKNPSAKAGDAGDKGSIPEKMATHSSIIAWETPWTEEPTGAWELQSMGLQRVRHNLGTDHTLMSLPYYP